jgi:hypothetical protein
MLSTIIHPNIIKYVEYYKNGIIKFIHSGRVKNGYMCIIYNCTNSETLFDKVKNTTLTIL